MGDLGPSDPRPPPGARTERRVKPTIFAKHSVSSRCESLGHDMTMNNMDIAVYDCTVELTDFTNLGVVFNDPTNLCGMAPLFPVLQPGGVVSLFRFSSAWFSFSPAAQMVVLSKLSHLAACGTCEGKASKPSPKHSMYAMY